MTDRLSKIERQTIAQRQAQGADPGTIAQELGVDRAQVAAFLHHQARQASAEAGAKGSAEWHRSNATTVSLKRAPWEELGG